MFGDGFEAGTADEPAFADALARVEEVQKFRSRLGDGLAHLVEGDGVELLAVLAAVLDERADAAVRVAEGHAQLDELLGEVGRHQRRIGGGFGHAVAADLHRADHRGVDREDRLDGVDRVEDRDLVLLQIAVVGERQTLAQGEERGQRAVDPRGLAAGELADVGVLLLRHQTRAGAPMVEKLITHQSISIQ